MTKSDWAAIHSSARHDWRTPPEVFDRLDRDFRFVLDAAAQTDSALCAEFLDPAEDALSLPVGEWAKRARASERWSAISSTTPWPAIWLNPPYGREVGRWVDRAADEANAGAVVVVLVMACTDTAWWSRAWGRAYEVSFIRGRIRFLDGTTGARAASAPKGSALITFGPETYRLSRPRVGLMHFGS